MLSKRSMQTLSAAEKHYLWRHARRRGQCVRCFHASMQRTAEHEVSGKGASQEESAKGSPKANLVENVQARPSPPNTFHAASPHQPTKPASMQDRRRHQRSAMISEEVKMVQRDHPSPSFAPDNPNVHSPAPPPTAQTPNPEGSAMGDNDPVGREGPTGQGIGKAVATEDDVPDTSIMARGVRSPHEGVEEPADGGAAVLEERVPLASGRVGALQGGDTQEPSRQRVVAAAAPEPVAPTTLSREELLHRGHDTSTPAGGDMQSTMLDHIRLVAHPGEQPSTERTPEQLAVKMMAGQLVHFHSISEKAATEEHAKAIAERRASNYAKQQSLSSDEAQPEAKNYHFAPVPESTRKGIIDRFGKGVYDPDGLLQGKQKYKNQPLLDQLARQTLKNSTYMTSDGDRFLRKVQSLLPRAEAQGQRGARAQRAKAR